MSTLFLTTDPTTGARGATTPEAMKAFNGIDDLTKFAVSYSPSTRIFTVTYSSGAAVWVGGTKHTKTGVATTTAHANTTGKYFLYYDAAGALTVGASTWDILTQAPLALAYYNAAAVAGILIDERHPAFSGMDNATHKNLHLTRGTQTVSGMVASGYTLSTAGQPALSYAISSGIIADEDLFHTVASLPDNGPYRILYLNSSGEWTWSDSSTTGILDNGTNLYYNLFTGGVWTLAPIATNSRWVNYYVLALPEMTGAKQIVVVMGQNIFTTLAAAQAEDPSTAIAGLSNLSDEFVYLYRMTYQRASGNSPSNALLVSAQAIRSNLISVSSGFNSSNHQSLSNRSDPYTHPAESIGEQSFVPANFTPVQVAGEGTDKVSAFLKGIDNSIKPIPEEFVSTGQTTFALAADIIDNDKIKVFIDGRLEREGAGNAWTRDSSANTITTTESVPAGKWVYVEILKA